MEAVYFITTNASAPSHNDQLNDLKHKHQLNDLKHNLKYELNDLDNQIQVGFHFKVSRSVFVLSRCLNPVA